MKKVREVNISPYCRLVLVPPIFLKLGIRGQLTDVITCVKFLVDRFRGYGVLTPPKLPFPIDLPRRPYNSVALPCDTVIRLITVSIVGVSMMPAVPQDDPYLLDSSYRTQYYYNNIIRTISNRPKRNIQSSIRHNRL